ncbi:HupE/UreJ family protein [Ensifer sp. MJa1]|uniref:HupE/UreJ family protein n=1 Tax=Ensifer sp. MJa1 TaxID=2919888 RepID=UPI003009677A
MSLRLLLFLLLVSISVGRAQGHELRPAYVEITETAAEAYDVLWKVPGRGEYRLSLYLRFPQNCRELVPPASTMADSAWTSRWRVHCAGGLAGRTITIDGLAGTYTDALARITRADGTMQTARLTPDFPDLVIAAAPTAADTARTYFLLGVQHILLGLDHLLFILALLLLIRRPRSLVETITAFTVAHSISLASAALGLVVAPQPLVEALVALSIVLVASEIVRRERGQEDLASTYPWIVAFLFGLLHGLGFGGALQEVGLPQRDVPLALLSFNLGVEAGQLLFVAAVLLAIASLRLLLDFHSQRPRLLMAYAIGSLSATWFIQRIAGFSG